MGYICCWTELWVYFGQRTGMLRGFPGIARPLRTPNDETILASPKALPCGWWPWEQFSFRLDWWMFIPKYSKYIQICLQSSRKEYHYLDIFGIFHSGWWFQSLFIFHFIYGMSSKPHWRSPSCFKMARLHHQPALLLVNISKYSHIIIIYIQIYPNISIYIHIYIIYIYW